MNKQNRFSCISTESSTAHQSLIASLQNKFVCQTRRGKCGLEIKIMNITGRTDNPNDILKHPANDSSSKHQWSFSKSARFPDKKQYTSTISYDLPSSTSRRKSGIGVGSRSTFFDGHNLDIPAPTKYEQASPFEGRKDRRGYSFGSNRQALKYANYLKQAENTPSAYGLIESQVKNTRAYSLRPKTAYPTNYFLPCNEETERIKVLPGPGKYQTIDMLGSGRNFCNSKFKTQKQKSFNGGERFSRSKRTPGPGDYSIDNTIEADGNCVLSTMKSNGRRQILNERRQLYMAGNKYTPGPGEYQKPSDFGHYDRPAPLARPKTARN